MKRRLILAGAGVVVAALVIWLAVAWAGRPKNDYSGTVETREIQIGSKVGGRVTEVGSKKARSSRPARRWCASSATS